jgi:hypothetical protein
MGDEEPRGDADSIFPPEAADETRTTESARPPGTRDRRRRLEGVIPEIVRRAVELGVEKAQEAPDNLKQFVGDLKVPKDIAHYLLSQVDETKNGLFRVVAKEMRDFLEHTNFAGEVQKLLTTVQFEVNTTIRFTPNDGRDKRRSAADDDDGGDREAEGSEAADEAGETSREGRDGGGRRPTPLPRPEVKTAVHVRRDDRDRRVGRARDRGT